MSNVMPRFVSIIITNYNYEEFLRESIDSALDQTYLFCEVIVVDDGSTDDSRWIINSYGTKIKIIYQTNTGQIDAANAGFLSSRGDPVIFLDADDLLVRSAVKDIVDVYEETKATKIHWPMPVIDRQGEPTDIVLPAGPLMGGDFVDRVALFGPFSYASPPMSGNAWSRDFLSRVCPVPRWGPEDRNGFDHYLIDMAPLYGDVAVVNKPLSLYRTHEKQSSGKRMADLVRRYSRRFEINRRRVSERLSAMGVAHDPASWRLSNRLFLEMESTLKDVIQPILAVVPDGESILTIDQDLLRTDLEGRYQIVPFLDTAGSYGGMPAETSQAVAEIDRASSNGVRWIVIPDTSQWALDYYGGLSQYLSRGWTRVVEGERVLILRRSEEAPAASS